MPKPEGYYEFFRWLKNCVGDARSKLLLSDEDLMEVFEDIYEDEFGVDIWHTEEWGPKP